MPKLLVIQHVSHEGLGTFGPVFREAGLTPMTLRADDPKALWPHAETVKGLVSMGGPQSVYEQIRHPYLTREIELMRQVVNAGKPVLGVCLGSQLLAAALGAQVTKNAQKEIGWYPLMREPDADHDPLWDSFGQTETVFQWHGDTFALPKGAVRLASSPLCAQQAFRYGAHAYGLQFHVEVTEAMIRSWLRANATELATVQGVIDPSTIRQHTSQHLRRLQELARHVASVFAQLVTQSNIQNPKSKIARSQEAPPHAGKT